MIRRCSPDRKDADILRSDGEDSLKKRKKQKADGNRRPEYRFSGFYHIIPELVKDSIEGRETDAE